MGVPGAGWAGKWIGCELVVVCMTCMYVLAHDDMYTNERQQIHGPYSTAEIMAWRAQGFFTGATAVEMRRVVEERAAKRQAQQGAGGGGDDGTGVKKVTFNAEALAADFDDDDDEDEEGGKGEGKGGGVGAAAAEWVNSDAVDWQAAMQG